MVKRTIQTHWNGKMKKLAGIIAGALGEENRRLKRPEPHFGFGRYIRLFEDGRLEIDSGANEPDVLALIDILTERGIVEGDALAADAMDASPVVERAEETDTVEEPESTEEAAEQNETTVEPETIEEPSERPTEPHNTTVSVEIRVPTSEQTEQTAESPDHHFTVSVPRSTLSDTALDNLQKMVDAKESLFKKSIGTDSLEIGVTEESITFPWFTAEEPAVEQAYTNFITLLCDKARKANRVTAKERDVENERYAMRGFLLQLGAIGKEYSVMRKVLMNSLSGSAAFRDQKRKSELVEG